MKIKIKVRPNARTEEVKQNGDVLVVSVKEPAEKGKANKAVVKLLEKYFERKVRIVSGVKNKTKVIEVID
ncbi:MAG: DUF167 domain-containing protein [Candidatus Aenigmarchaeota archaeon]|nr:DUF167 domain-containing protein [Candidatus Aenigmarchaeota archaeon]